MKSKPLILTAWLWLLGACTTPEEGAPFFWNFKMISETQFEYAALGNMDFPANTETGEQARMSFLSEHLKRNGICPNGYMILSREPEHISGRSNIDKQRYRWIIYSGQCHV